MEKSFVAIIEDQPCTLDAAGLISALDMADCFGHVQAAYLVEEQGCLTRLQLHGPWHADDPLYIKVTDSEGKIIADGYGTDH